MEENNESKVIFPELSYKIVGILFDVWNNIGYGHKEIFYQKAIAKSLKENNISFKEQEKTVVK